MANFNFGERLGSALATGAESVAQGLQRKYEEKMRREREKLGIGMQLMEAGIQVDPNNPASIHAGMEAYRAKKAEMMEMETEKRAAEIEKTRSEAEMMKGLGTGGGPQFFTGPGGVQYTVTPSKYGPRVQFPTPAPIAINPNTGESIQLPRGGKIVEPSGAANAKLTITKAQGFTNALDELEDFLTKVPSGRISGGGAKLLNKTFGLFPEVRTAESLGGLMIPMATRIIGGDVGNLNEQEQKAAMHALQLVNGTLEERRQSIALLRDLLKSKKTEAETIIKGGKIFQSSPIDYEQKFDEFSEQGLSQGLSEEEIYRRWVLESQ